MDRDKQRTNQQNKALHKYFAELANELNDHGLDMRTFLKPGIEIWWTPEMVKNYIWRPVQEIMFSKLSTTQLTTTEIDKVLDIITRKIGQDHGLQVDFPSIDGLLNKQRIKEND